ncbi:MAG: CopD family protein [Paucibacter sp.]|nr:CopD family protein [Roseateles sp.]
MLDGALSLLMRADLVAIHLGLALVMSSLASELWMEGRRSAWATGVVAQAAQARQTGFLLGLIGLGASLWFEAAAMSESPLFAAGAALGALLAHTHYGHAALVGLFAWLAAAGFLRVSHVGARKLVLFVAGLSGVCVFVVTRSAVSHAASQGDLTVDVAVDAIHLALVCLWVGVVIAGARLMIPSEALPAADRSDVWRWVSKMSSTATVAIAGILASGLFKIWRGWMDAGSLGTYIDSAYGHALVVKLALVAVAATLGGLNRFVGLPRLQAQDQGGGHRWLLLVLRAEACTLLLVLVAAAVLSSSELPGTS